MDDSFTESLTFLLSRNKSVRELILWMPSNYLSDVGAGRIFAELAGMVRLRKLVVNMEWNFDLTNRAVEELCRNIRLLPEVETLIIRMSK